MLSKIAGIPAVWKWIGLGVLALALVAAIVIGFRGIQNDEREENNQLIEQGIVVEREAGQREVIKDVEEARDAVSNPTVNELNVVCEKYDRNC
jgi:uncharacterized protein YpmS